MNATGSRRLFLSRDALLYAALALAFVVASSIGAFLFVDNRVEQILLQRQATIVDSELKLLQLVDREEGRDGLVRSIARRVAVPTDDFAIQALIDRNGKYLAGDESLTDLVQSLPEILGGLGLVTLRAGLQNHMDLVKEVLAASKPSLKASVRATLHRSFQPTHRPPPQTLASAKLICPIL